MTTFDGTNATFPAWKRLFLCLAKLHDIFETFTEGVGVPVEDEGMSVAALYRAFPGENIQRYFVSSNILSRALKGSTGRDTLLHLLRGGVNLYTPIRRPRLAPKFSASNL